MKDTPSAKVASGYNTKTASAIVGKMPAVKSVEAINKANSPVGKKPAATTVK